LRTRASVAAVERDFRHPRDDRLIDNDQHFRGAICWPHVEFAFLTLFYGTDGRKFPERRFVDDGEC
jgi:hypothetical protein